MSALDTLKVNIKLTTKARFHAHKRLRAHGWFSQWTLAALAVGQIVISLLPPLDIELRFTDDYMAFGSVFFGTLVLAYSLLLGISDFNSRSVLFHECGLELNRLYQEFFYGEAGNKSIDELINRYNDILGKYENHAEVDHVFSVRKHLQEGRRKTAKTGVKPVFSFSYLLLYVRQYSYNILQFSHYIVSVLVMAIWIFFAI